MNASSVDSGAPSTGPIIPLLAAYVCLASSAASPSRHFWLEACSDSIQDFCRHLHLRHRALSGCQGSRLILTKFSTHCKRYFFTNVKLNPLWKYLAVHSSFYFESGSLEFSPFDSGLLLEVESSDMHLLSGSLKPQGRTRSWSSTWQLLYMRAPGSDKLPWKLNTVLVNRGYTNYVSNLAGKGSGRRFVKNSAEEEDYKVVFKQQRTTEVIEQMRSIIFMKQNKSSGLRYSTEKWDILSFNDWLPLPLL